MRFQKIVSLTLIVLLLLHISINCLSLSRKNTLGNNAFHRKPLKQSGIVKNGEGKTEQSRTKRDPILDAFKFPETEYPVPLLNTQTYGIKNIANSMSANKIEMTDFLKEFSAVPNYRDIGNFPEVEYPLSASEMWKPNYWNGYWNDEPPVQGNNNLFHINTKLNKSLHHESKAVKNTGKTHKSGTLLKTKSYSNPTKNLNQLRNGSVNSKFFLESNKNVSNITNVDNSQIISENTEEKVFSPSSNEKSFTSGSILGLPKSQLKLSDFYTTVTPFSFTSHVTDTPNECGIDMGPKDSEAFSMVDKDSLNVTKKIKGKSSKKKKASSHANKVKKERNAAMKSKSDIITDEISLNNANGSENLILKNDNDLIIFSQAEYENKENASPQEEPNNFLVDEDYTTDVYPEFEENSNSFISLSTVAPLPLTTADLDWKDVKIIENYKPLWYDDELSEYFIAT